MIAARNSFLMGGAKLPYDAEVEYIESTGTQYIISDLTYFPDFELDVQLRSNITTYGVLNGSKSDDTTFWYVGNTKNSPCWYLFDNNQHIETLINPTTRCKMTFRSGVFTANGSIIETGITNPFEQCVLCLFARYYSTPKVWAAMLYSFKAFDVNGELVQDLIPVRVGELGYLYDRVSGKLFGNAGTGAFVIGPDK